MTTAKDHARQIFRAAIDAVDPAAAIHAHCRVVGTVLRVDDLRYDLDAIGDIILVGAGKASAIMAQAVTSLLGSRISAGSVVVKYGHGAAVPGIPILEAGHPIPDQAGETAARTIEGLVRNRTARDLVIACWSGGASALLPAPRPGLTLVDKQAVTALLLASGADIREINAVRKHLSRLKGGQLARCAAPAQVLCLVISDVIGDDLATIGSGPFCADPSTFAEVQDILARYALKDRLPPAVAAFLARAPDQAENETPKSGHACFTNVRHVQVASNRQALQAAARAAVTLGYTPVVEEEPMQGEARLAAQRFCARARTLGDRHCFIAGGETTVTLGEDPGQGGRNQEFTLACALHLAGVPGITILAAGSDGNDGPTDAAGALCDSTSAARGRALGLDAAVHLDRHDAYHFFAGLNDLLITGATRTNVMDISLALCRRD